MICGALNENSGIVDIVWGLTEGDFKVKGIEIIDKQNFIKNSESV